MEPKQVQKAQNPEIVDYASRMSDQDCRNLVNRTLNTQKQNTQTQQSTGYSTYAQRKEAMVKEAQYEAILARNLSTASGLKKIAANLANPVREQLDYRGIGRKFAVVEQIPDGVPIIYDRDLPAVPAIRVGRYGSCNQVQMRGIRIELEPFETVCRTRIPYSELYTRRFRALDRTKDRIIEGMQLREDLIIFSAIATAAAVTNTAVVETGALTRAGMARAFAQIERHRLVVGSVLMTAFGISGIRRFQFQTLDQVGMQIVRETGYLGQYWGADIYVTDQLNDGQAYALGTPKFNAWLPIRKDMDIIPADDPDNFELGMNGYQYWAFTWHNTRSAESHTFVSTA